MQSSYECRMHEFHVWLQVFTVFSAPSIRVAADAWLRLCEFDRNSIFILRGDG